MQITVDTSRIYDVRSQRPSVALITTGSSPPPRVRSTLEVLSGMNKPIDVLIISQQDNG